MKVFSSLNCCICKSPFAPIANQLKSPRYLDCGKAACHECFEAEKALKVEERKHKCGNANCFYNPNFAFYLIDILSEVTLVQSPIGAGYMLSKPLNAPECPICHEEYSTEGKITPNLLYCLHSTCWGCFEKCRKPNNRIQKDIYPFSLSCSMCGHHSISNKTSPVRNHFLEFLEELPEMTRQFEGMKTSPFRFCADCKSLDSIERMFDCAQCKKKICGTCALLKHHVCNHKVSKLLEKEALDLSKNMQKQSICEVSTYQNLFSGLHVNLDNIVKDFLEKLAFKEEMLRKKPTFEALQKSYDKCNHAQSDFESFSEEYMPSLRKYYTNIEGLVEELKQDPD